MEGAGSRQSRASSRYASGPSPAPFNGPVRRWKKQWVSDNQNKPNKRNDAPPLLLCRWTPLSAADEPPRRRARYTPIVPIEKGNMMKSTENEGRGGSIRNQSSNGSMLEPSTVDISKEEAQEVNEDEAETEEY
ncbi:hypothetical protein ACS0TY_033464 [Phlomoides rotata]